MRSSEKVSLPRLSVLNVYEICFVCVLSKSVCFVHRRRRWMVMEELDNHLTTDTDSLDIDSEARFTERI